MMKHALEGMGTAQALKLGPHGVVVPFLSRPAAARAPGSSLRVDRGRTAS
jgi:hypothetical protein